MGGKNQPELWLEFARINPGRWKSYEGHCVCESCIQYREDAGRWIGRRLAERAAEAEAEAETAKGGG